MQVVQEDGKPVYLYACTEEDLQTGRALLREERDKD
jgi:hypothetical protein